jgi:hypothetical protein
MTTIVTRAGKGSPLTHTEVDTNFTNLNTAKLETAAIPLGTLAAPSISFTGDANTGVYSPGADTLAFVTAGANRLHITSGGLVGLGTSSPSEKLTVSGGSIDLPTVNTFIKGGGHNVLQVDATRTYFYGGTDGVQLRTADNLSSLINITNAGLVGIGTSSPASALDVSGGSIKLRNASSGSNYGYEVDVNHNTSVSQKMLTARYMIAGASGSYTDIAGINAEIENSATNLYGMSFRTGGATAGGVERARIDSSGRLLVSTTSASPHSSGTYGIALDTSVGVKIGSNNTHALIAARWNGDGEAIRLQRDNATVGTISVTTTATTYNTSSDYRLKENVTPVPNGIDRLLQLKPSRFNFIADPDRTVDGFLAHEAQAVVPECVTGEKDAVDEDGNPVMQGIDQSKLVPLLTAALQEAIAKIEALETRLSALEAA